MNRQFDFICYGGSMVKRVDFKSVDQHYQCPHARNLNGGFRCCKDCDGKMEGVVEIKVRFV